MLLNDTLELISNEYRRKMMYALEAQKYDAVEYDDILKEMIGQGYMRDEERQRFKAQMEHVHLPKLEDSGLIEYNGRSETIRRVPDEDVERLLEFVKEFE